MQDAAVRVRALSRWNNYYVEGIRQMARDVGSNGVYLDEIAYDRVTMMRVRSVLGDGGVIDHHANSNGDSGGSPSCNYMELFPFIDRLWYVESAVIYGESTTVYPLSNRAMQPKPLAYCNTMHG